MPTPPLIPLRPRTGEIYRGRSMTPSPINENRKLSEARGLTLKTAILYVHTYVHI